MRHGIGLTGQPKTLVIFRVLLEREEWLHKILAKSRAGNRNGKKQFDVSILEED